MDEPLLLASLKEMVIVISKIGIAVQELALEVGRSDIASELELAVNQSEARMSEWC